jgi:hypothetical protein
MTCEEACAAALQVPRLLDELCGTPARPGTCDSLLPLHQLLSTGGPRVAARAACEPGLLLVAVRVAGGAEHAKAGAALGFLAALLQELGRAEAGRTGPAEIGESELALANVAAATPAIADAAARGVVRLELTEYVGSAVSLLGILLRPAGTRPAAARAARDARAVPALLRLMSRPDSLESASCIAFLSRVEPGRAELMNLRPAVFATLAAALRRTAAAGAGDRAPSNAACVVRAVAELIRGDEAAAAAFLDIALPGGVLPALAHHIYNPDSGMCHGAAEVAAALAEAADASGPERLAAVAAAPGLLTAAATALARVLTSSPSASCGVCLQAHEELSPSEFDETVTSTVGDLVVCLYRLTAAGAAAAASLVGVEGLEAALAAVAANPAAWPRMDDTAAAPRVLLRLRAAAAAQAPATEAAAEAAAEPAAEPAAGEARGEALLAAECAACRRTQAEEGVRLRLCRGCRAVRCEFVDVLMHA